MICYEVNRQPIRLIAKIFAHFVQALSNQYDDRDCNHREDNAVGGRSAEVSRFYKSVNHVRNRHRLSVRTAVYRHQVNLQEDGKHNRDTAQDTNHNGGPNHRDYHAEEFVEVIHTFQTGIFHYILGQIPHCAAHNQYVVARTYPQAVEHNQRYQPRGSVRQPVGCFLHAQRFQNRINNTHIEHILICRDEDYDRNNRRQEEDNSKERRPTDFLVEEVCQDQRDEKQEQIVQPKQQRVADCIGEMLCRTKVHKEELVVDKRERPAFIQILEAHSDGVDVYVNEEHQPLQQG